nr:hypothetical protein [Legionella feeleii]
MDKFNIKSLEELAEVLKNRRRELNITQKSLADFCNLSHNGKGRYPITVLRDQYTNNTRWRRACTQKAITWIVLGAHYP